MNKPLLEGKTILVTGAARRAGRLFALGCAQAGANVVIHHGHSPEQASATRDEIAALGRQVWVLSSDLENPVQASETISRAFQFAPLYGLVNSAAIFDLLDFSNTSLSAWDRHMAINLTAPLLLSQAFAQNLPAGAEGRIVNILDWRAVRPGTDHFPYTISKAALAALTRSLAVALAPRFTVNGLLLGAVLPPADGGTSQDAIKNVPLRRWSEPQEVQRALVFLLAGPAYITGQLLHLDGGRHLI
jgi:NAD(P)-dependent dehydrogenase (short-subunit alcohol dehydrogenase family)